jgi:hypothetical protein
MGPTGHLKTNTTRRPDLTALPCTGRLSAHVERSSRTSRDGDRRRNCCSGTRRGSVNELPEVNRWVFCRNLARHGFNFFRVVVFSIPPRVLDSHERDRAKARSDGTVGDKDVSAFRWLEGGAQASFCHEGVKVALNWTPYLADARVRGALAPKEGLPNSVPHSTHQTIARVIQTIAWTRVTFRQQLPGLLTSRSPSGNGARGRQLPAARVSIPLTYFD